MLRLLRLALCALLVLLVFSRTSHAQVVIRDSVRLSLPAASLSPAALTRAGEPWDDDGSYVQLRATEEYVIYPPTWVRTGPELRFREGASVSFSGEVIVRGTRPSGAAFDLRVPVDSLFVKQTDYTYTCERPVGTNPDGSLFYPRMRLQRFTARSGTWRAVGPVEGPVEVVYAFREKTLRYTFSSADTVEVETYGVYEREVDGRRDTVQSLSGFDALGSYVGRINDETAYRDPLVPFCGTTLGFALQYRRSPRPRLTGSTADALMQGSAPHEIGLFDPGHVYPDAMPIPLVLHEDAARLGTLRDADGTPVSTVTAGALRETPVYYHPDGPKDHAAALAPVYTGLSAALDDPRFALPPASFAMGGFRYRLAVNTTRLPYGQSTPLRVFPVYDDWTPAEIPGDVLVHRLDLYGIPYSNSVLAAARRAEEGDGTPLDSSLARTAKQTPRAVLSPRTASAAQGTSGDVRDESARWGQRYDVGWKFAPQPLALGACADETSWGYVNVGHIALPDSVDGQPLDGPWRGAVASGCDPNDETYVLANIPLSVANSGVLSVVADGYAPWEDGFITTGVFARTETDDPAAEYENISGARMLRVIPPIVRLSLLRQNDEVVPIAGDSAFTMVSMFKTDERLGSAGFESPYKGGTPVWSNLDAGASSGGDLSTYRAQISGIPGSKTVTFRLRVRRNGAWVRFQSGDGHKADASGVQYYEYPALPGKLASGDSAYRATQHFRLVSNDVDDGVQGGQTIRVQLADSVRISAYYDGKEQTWVAYSVGRGPETEGLFSIRTARLTWAASDKAATDANMATRTVEQMNEIWAQSAIRFRNTTGVRTLRDEDISNVIEIQFLKRRPWPLSDVPKLVAQSSGSVSVNLPVVSAPVTLSYQQGDSLYAVARRLRDLAIARVPGATAHNTYLRSGETRYGPVSGVSPSYNIPAEIGKANRYHLVIGRGLNLAPRKGDTGRNHLMANYEKFSLDQVRIDQLPVVAARFKDEYAALGAENDSTRSNIDVIVLPHKAVYSQQTSAANQDAGNDLLFGKGMSDAYRDSTYEREGNQLLPELANTLLLNASAIQPSGDYPNVAGHEAGHVFGIAGHETNPARMNQHLMKSEAPLNRTVSGPYRLDQGSHAHVRRRSGTSRDGVSGADAKNPALLR